MKVRYNQFKGLHSTYRFKGVEMSGDINEVPDNWSENKQFNDRVEQGIFIIIVDKPVAAPVAKKTRKPRAKAVKPTEPVKTEAS